MWNRYVGVGIFVVVGTVLFALAIFLIGNQHNFFAKHIELYTEFKNLNGLAKGAKVRVGGFDAGEVTDISVPGSPSAGFRLKLQLNAQVRGLVRTDSVATIVTEGVVGDKFVMIGPGSPTSPEAAPFTTLPSKETSDIAELIQKSTALVSDASGTMKVVADKLTATLDSVTTTVNNANDLVVGMKQGRGTIGMLLRDEKTAAEIRQAVANVRDATSSLNHASDKRTRSSLISNRAAYRQKRIAITAKADAIISDLQSRNFGEKLDQTMETVHSAAHNIDATTQQLRRPLRKLSHRTRKAEMQATTFVRRSQTRMKLLPIWPRIQRLSSMGSFSEGSSNAAVTIPWRVWRPTSIARTRCLRIREIRACGSKLLNFSSQSRVKAKCFLPQGKCGSMQRLPSLAIV